MNSLLGARAEQPASILQGEDGRPTSSGSGVRPAAAGSGFEADSLVRHGWMLGVRAALAGGAARRRAGMEIELSRVWRELVRGRIAIVDVFCTERRCHVVLSPCPRASTNARQADAGGVGVLERILLGESRKVIALEHDVNERTVAATAMQALRAIGCRARLSRLPMPLFTLVHAAHGKTDVKAGCLGSLECEDGHYRLLSIDRVDGCLDDFLSPAEAAVARLLLEGYSHHEIAALRQTARHTVANQLTATFRKLEVSGRSELFCALHRDPRMWALRRAGHCQVAQIAQQ